MDIMFLIIEEECIGDEIVWDTSEIQRWSRFNNTRTGTDELTESCETRYEGDRIYSINRWDMVFYLMAEIRMFHQSNDDKQFLISRSLLESFYPDDEFLRV